MTPGPFQKPAWIPRVEANTRILVTGASGGIGRAVVSMLAEGSDCLIGAHGASSQTGADNHQIISIQKTLETEADCLHVVDTFVEKAGGIDGLVLLNGALHHRGHWMEMPEEAWNQDMAVNLSHHFFLARRALKAMKDQRTGGRIVFNSTESAHHGGSSDSMPYAMAKLGTECMVKGMAREGAPDGVLVNAVRLGFIESGFHQRWSGRDSAFLKQRAEMVPLKRGGHPDEAAALIVYLLSGWSRFITGQMFALTGGDWL